MSEKHILDFIREHHIFTLAVSKDNIPWCATCYYVYLPAANLFIFTSDPDTRHIRDAVEGNNFTVAGTIALETRIVGKIRGLQFSGVIRIPEGAALDHARAAYLKRFPIARFAPELHLWELVPDFFKMTDNRFGFGKKFLWKPESN